MKEPSVHPINAYYLFIFLIISLLAALFLHLGLVMEMKFFQNFSTNSSIIFGIICILILIPKSIKYSAGEKVIPILKSVLVLKGKGESFEQLEKHVYEQRALRLEEDKKIKSNPFLYTFFVVLIILSFVGFAFLMIYSATGNF